MEARWQRAETAGVGTIQPGVQSEMMLNRARCIDQERMIIMNRCEGQEKDESHAKLKEQLEVEGVERPSRSATKAKGGSAKLELEEGEEDSFMASDMSLGEEEGWKKEGNARGRTYA